MLFRLLNNIDKSRISVNVADVINSAKVTHLNISIPSLPLLLLGGKKG
jgi:hypothetical protein